ncbi:sterol desaturase family protein [Terasakiella sp. SH-1]|uniref:sterol desaturase family protein n=1 Tax=Terasakiella sp. SH-1 TaxID=2560057 RepID=UPI001073DF65|nr:sterol desaturase family protein [Terasakiella sp. SH-1]
MSEFITSNEGFIRLGVFFSVFCLVAFCEGLFPKRARLFPRGQRWGANIGVLLIGGLCVRVFMPWVPVSVAYYVSVENAALMNISASTELVNTLLGVVILDLAIYMQHRAMHKIPILWRLHRMHHCDLECDVTTGIRFHPLEIIISIFYKIVVIFIFGIDVLAVIIFEILLNAMAMFNHANLKLPFGVDRMVRLFIVTPDMHRVHHSVLSQETNSNYGFFLSCWDRAFQSYTSQPMMGHDKMTIGLADFKGKSCLKLWSMLKIPFKGKA